MGLCQYGSTRYDRYSMVPTIYTQKKMKTLLTLFVFIFLFFIFYFFYRFYILTFDRILLDWNRYFMVPTMFVDLQAPTEIGLTALIRPLQSFVEGFRHGGRRHLFSTDVGLVQPSATRCAHHRELNCTEFV